MTKLKAVAGEGPPPARPGEVDRAAAAIADTDVYARLSEAEETLRAIRNGEVDALVVRDAGPEAQVFTLSSADRPYRIFVENMRDGAATVSAAGVIVYANQRLAELVGRPLQQIIGSPVQSFISPRDRSALRAISGQDRGVIEVELIAGPAQTTPVRVSASTQDVDTDDLLCLTFADLTEQNAQRLEIARLSEAQADRLRELEHAQAALTQQATHDALTGLPNRSLLIDRLTQALALSERSGTSTGLIFVDLDNFKEINDTGGHAAGDMVLRQTARRLLGAVRPMDSVARLGGDEFVVLLPALKGLPGAREVAARVARLIETPVDLDHGPVPVAASIGVSICEPPLGRHASPDTLLRQADTAMYYAKSLGGSRIEIFDGASTPTVNAADSALWIARIRRALTEGGFVLLAQPIVELATGTVVQHELLLRMRDGNELIAPMAFLPTAERCGLMAEIDRWVIGEATKIAAHGKPVAVNLSAASAGDPGVLELIERELQLHTTDPANLVFEITETIVMNSLDRATKFAGRLVALGCRFALDDFGTGFASFTYLKRLPVQYLKIDTEFVRDLAGSQRDMAVVRAIVALAADFGQQTIAEGVENQYTAEVLRDLGVTFAQGYFYGRPDAILGRQLVGG